MYFICIIAFDAYGDEWPLKERKLEIEFSKFCVTQWEINK